MKTFRSFFPALALVAALLPAACSSPEPGDEDEAFSVQFSLVSVQDNLTLDSLEIEIIVGDTGSPQAFTIDLATGTSKTQVMAYPGQKFTLNYTLYASGYDIGSGADTGTLAKDKKIELRPIWNLSKVESAKAARATGKLLPTYLGPTFGQALAGKPVEFKIDSSAGHTYTWYIRLPDSTVVSGTGTRISYTPGDSLAGSTVNIKLVVKKGSQVAEERDWDVKVLGPLPNSRLIGVVTKTDTTSDLGSYTRFKYNADGKYDSILYYDTSVLVSGRAPVSGISITYTQAHHPGGDPSKVVHWWKNQSDVDSMFSYDNQGRLTAITVTLKSGTTVDSLFYPPGKSTVSKSFAQGKIMREVHTFQVSETAEVDSIWSPGDSGLALTGLVKYDLDGGRVVNKRIYRKFAGLEPVASEWTQYNALGSVSFRNQYEEGASLMLNKTETWSYRADGLLERIAYKDEVTGELEKMEYRRYESSVPAKFGAGSRFWAKANAIQDGNRERALSLARINRYFPIAPSPSTW